MAYKRDKLVKDLKGLLRDLGGKIKINSAYLFGSYAKGKTHRWSDIDLAVVSPQFKGIRFIDSKMLIPYTKDFPGMVEFHPFKKGEFTPQNLFVKEIIKNGIKLK